MKGWKAVGTACSPKGKRMTDLNYMVMTQKESNREMGFKKAIAMGWKNIFNFRGKASRSEHWWWVLFVALFILVLMIVVAVISLIIPVEYIGEDSMDRSLTLVVFMGGEALCLFLLPLLLISSQVRRFHDVGKTSLIPIFGLSLYEISLACLCCAFTSEFVMEALHINGNSETASYIFFAETIINGAIALVFSIITLMVCLNSSKRLTDCGQ